MVSEEAKEGAKDKTAAAKTGDKKETVALFKGLLTLSIMPPVDLEQLKRLEESLNNSPDLRLVLVGGSVSSGTEMVVSMENAIPLVDILMNVPSVYQVNKKGNTLQITLKSE